MLLNFREPDIHILSRQVSESGKYLGFFGIHYHKGVTCYVVGASNKQNGEITMRHYNEKAGCINIEAAKFAATQYWEETFVPILVKKAESSEDDERYSELSSWFDRANKQIFH